MKVTSPFIQSIFIILLIMSLTACATLYTIAERIPGLDRIIHSQSKAEVGPVIDENGRIIEGTLIENSINVDSTVQNTLVENNKKKEEFTGEKKAKASSDAIQPSGNADQEDKATTRAESKQKNTSNESEQPSFSPDITASHSVPEFQTKKGSVSGQVTILAKNRRISPVGMILRVNRKDGTRLRAQQTMNSHDMDMEDKVYFPGSIAIHKGDTVNFINKDKIQHNVFSSSGENAFDLGTFGGGLQRGVKLNQEGIVKVYCNIHPNMAAYVAVDDAGISQVLENDSGAFSFTDLPTGDYTLNLWSIRGEKKVDFTVTNERTTNLNVSFDTSDYVPPKRVNKFGDTYKKRKVSNEFY